MSNVLRNARGERGFTLVEVAIIILVLVILSAILIPQIGVFNRFARKVKLEEDLIVLCTMLKVMLDDTGESEFLAEDDASPSVATGLLVGAGSTPDEGDVTAPGGGAGFWTLGLGTTFDETPDVDFDTSASAVTFDVDRFENHIIQNDPGGDDGIDPEYDTLVGASEGFNALFGWRGPYIADRIDPDPFGTRYAANVFALHREGEDGFSSAVVCYSAGPDKDTDTVFNQPANDTGGSVAGDLGWTTGGDDSTVVLSSGGGISP